MSRLLLLVVLAGACASPSPEREARSGLPVPTPETPFLAVLGIGQDGGVPQTGDWDHPGWTDPGKRRLVSSLGLIDPESGTSLLLDATPDLPRQLRRMHLLGASGLPAIFLTHAHIGHYAGLMYLGHESMGASDVNVHAMPRMAAFLRADGPWSQLVNKQNIQLSELEAGTPVQISPFAVTAVLVPHRQEYSEVVGYHVQGPSRSVLFIPDIDSWEDWDAWGESIEEHIARVDLAFLDATFFANGEVPGRDMSGFPHPFITHSMQRFEDLPESERAKIHFIHLNHSNPALWDGPERQRVIDAGFRMAVEGALFEL
ncbi:MAG: MBL fold metallo-hydrolase [Rhodothermales bacterium]|nr:MBL fold metallo-hydrolase [Rhodothermales bacterium]MBO6779532.1 MBL fold metallo-hydrolase [Rhodothermales bacterium]